MGGVSSGNRFKIERNFESPRRFKVVYNLAETHKQVIYSAGILEVPDLIIKSMPGWYRVQFLLSRQAEQDWVNLPKDEKDRLNQLEIHNAVLFGMKMLEADLKHQAR